MLAELIFIFCIISSGTLASFKIDKRIFEESVLIDDLPPKLDILDSLDLNAAKSIGGLDALLECASSTRHTSLLLKIVTRSEKVNADSRSSFKMAEISSE